MIGLPRPCLALITDRRRALMSLPAVVGPAVRAGVDLVQLREPDLPHAELAALARAVRPATAGRALLIVNGAAEVALASGAEGVHLPEASGTIAAVRAMVGPERLIGRSVHSLAAACRAAEEGADYIQVGAIFPTSSHSGRPPVGLELLRAIRAEVRLPILAVGGITAETAGRVLAAGADGIAVISAILAHPEPGAAARELRAAMLAGGMEGADARQQWA